MTDDCWPRPGSSRIDVTLSRGSAIALATFGLLPISRWIPGGLVDENYFRRWTEWGYGIGICAGTGLVFAILSRSPWSALESAWRRWWSRAEAAAAHAGICDLGVAFGCFLLYGLIARFVFSAKPLLIDEMVQVLQARMYVSGQLSTATDSAREFFSVLHVVDIGNRMYSQFPPGWPVMLMLGVMTDTAWLVGPLCGAVSVWIFAKLIRRSLPEAGALTSVLGAALFGLCPFAAFQFSSQMSHGPVLMWLLISTLAFAHLSDERSDMPASGAALAFAAGLALGCAFSVRPLDAVAFGIPAGVWMAWRAMTGRLELRALAFAVGGLALPVAGVMLVNANTTGSPFEFGYEALWGSAHGLGFHAAPWGDAHTPLRGIELLSAYVTRLNVYFLESPFPALLPVMAGLAFTTHLSRVERYLLAGTLLHAILHFAYWHDGYFLGPRFVVPWLPLLVLLCIRLALRTTWHAWSRPIRAAICGSVGAGILMTALISLPRRVEQYRSGLTSMRADYSAAARAAGVQGAIVFVRESWGAQLIARLWALGISRTATAALYAKVDACVLEHAVGEAEHGRVRGIELEAVLQPLLHDSLSVHASTVSPDSTERMMSGARYDAVCADRVSADREGYALFPPLLLEHSSGNIYVRDFEKRDSVIMRRYPNRPAFLLRRDGVDGAAPLRWIRIARGG